MFKPNNQWNKALNNKLIQENNECHYFKQYESCYKISSYWIIAINCYIVLPRGLPSRAYKMFQDTLRFNGSY